MTENSPSLRAQPKDEGYFHHNIQGNALTILFLPTNFNASALYDLYNASKYNPRPFVQENMTYTVLTPMVINVLGRK